MSRTTMLLSVGLILFAQRDICRPQTVDAADGQPAGYVAHVQIFGPGSLFSANLEKSVIGGLWLRTGIGVSGFDSQDAVTIPLIASYLVGFTHRFEVSAGVVYKHLFGYSGMTNRGEFQKTASFGYRYQPALGGFMFRIAADPFALYGKSSDGGPQRLVGASLGYAF